MKTREESKAYFDKLYNTLGKDYPLYYYEVVSDKDLNLDYKGHSDLEKIIKVTLLDEKENKDKIWISVISVDLTNTAIPIAKKRKCQVLDTFFTIIM